MAVGLDAEHDELVTAGRLPLLQDHSLAQVGGHADGAGVARAPAAAALRARRRLSPRGDAVPDQFVRPKRRNRNFGTLPSFHTGALKCSLKVRESQQPWTLTFKGPWGAIH